MSMMMSSTMMPTMLTTIQNAPFAQLQQLQQTMAIGGAISSVFGTIGTSIGAYAQAKSQQYQFRSQALNLAFQSQMSALNKRQSEFAAQTATQAAQKAIGRYTMAAGQAKAAAKTEMAARGLTLGTGSTRDIVASMDLMKDIDKLTMEANAVREAEAYRTQATNLGIQSSMQAMSARNMQAMARGISPFMSAGSTLLGGAQDVGGWWLKNKRDELMLQAMWNMR